MAHYTAQELDDAALWDLRVEVETSRHQAEHGPFYPDRGITSESLTAFAEKCERMIERYKDGGAHKAVIKYGVED